MKYAGDTISSVEIKPVSDVHRWILAGVMLSVIGFGWRYPVVGFMVPVVMAAGIAGSFWRGRYVCGNFCPRGSFYDTMFRLVGGSRPIPEFMRKPGFRWGFMIVLMTALGLQISLKPNDPLHWGFVFWTACTVTTVIGIAAGAVFKARTWCSFCPVGTMGAAFGVGKYQLQIDHSCRSCGLCDKACPMELSVSQHAAAGALPHGDCIKCSSCVNACKIGALSWPEK